MKLTKGYYCLYRAETKAGWSGLDRQWVGVCWISEVCWQRLSRHAPSRLMGYGPVAAGKHHDCLNRDEPRVQFTHLNTLWNACNLRSWCHNAPLLSTAGKVLTNWGTATEEAFLTALMRQFLDLVDSTLLLQNYVRIKCVPEYINAKCGGSGGRAHTAVCPCLYECV